MRRSRHAGALVELTPDQCDKPLVPYFLALRSATMRRTVPTRTVQAIRPKREIRPPVLLISIAVATFVVGTPARPVLGQDLESASFSGDQFLDLPESNVNLFESTCPPVVSKACDYPTRLQSTCAVVGFDTLGTVANRTYLLGRYRRSTVIASSSDGNEDWTCEADEVLLLESISKIIVRPVWLGATERSYQFIRDVSLVNSAETDFLSVRYCLNGTGGCADRIFVWYEAAWQVLERDSTWEQVYARLPAGYRLHKSPPPDLMELTWEQHVAGPGDANCCPSGRLQLKLTVSGSRLSISRAIFEIDIPIGGE